MKKVEGINVSYGIVFGKVYLVNEEKIKFERSFINDIEGEIKKFFDARNKAKEQIMLLKADTLKKFGQDKAKIFDAHMDILFDIEIESQIKDKIRNEKIDVSSAVFDTGEFFKNMFLSMDDEYMRERAADINDVISRVLKILNNIKIIDLSLIKDNVIIVTHDLTPGQTSQLDPNYIKGFITKIGGRTSHSAIMARALGIPAISKIDEKNFHDNDFVIIDSEKNLVIINPTQEVRREYAQKIKIINEQKNRYLIFKNKKVKTIDGFETNIEANIISPSDVEISKINGADGIGLFRTEFLYMGVDNWPDEKKQFDAYKTVLENMEDKKVVIRTLDIGGDKNLKYYNFPKELNPFLGYRAIRLQLDQKDKLITQARALLRASYFGRLAINIPMISTIDEIREVKAIFSQVEKQLKAEGHKVKKYELGIMVEVPSVVELIDKFVKYVDFFSIGTNDLLQYTFAVDRMSENLSYLYQPMNPAILRKIKNVIDASHKMNKWTGICGELANDKKMTPIFIGMGLDSFSMSANSILEIKSIVSQLNKKDCEKLVEKLINLETEKEVIKEVNLFFKNHRIKI